MELLFIFGGVCVALLIISLVVRESTEQRLRRLRVELMTLRSQIRLLEGRLKSYESVRAQVREVLQRIDSRKLSANDTIENIYDKLRELHLLLRERELPDMESGPGMERDVKRESESERVGA